MVVTRWRAWWAVTNSNPWTGSRWSPAQTRPRLLRGSSALRGAAGSPAGADAARHAPPGSGRAGSTRSSAAGTPTGTADGSSASWTLLSAPTMGCPRNRVNSSARFCEDCGARLEAACPSCGTPVTPGKKFCRSCGAALTTEPAGRCASPESYTPKHLAEKILTSKAALEGERKQVTVLFADLKGSMELLADRDPEEARKLH